MFLFSAMSLQEIEATGQGIIIPENHALTVKSFQS